MSEPYTAIQYLLDRANITDTLRKITLYYDTHDVNGLATEVYAKEITVDYSVLSGGKPFTLPGAAFAENVGKIISKYDRAQHVTSNVVVNLPQPGDTVSKPNTASAYAQADGHLVKNNIHNGCIYDVEFARDTDLEKDGQQPWRVTKHQVLSKGWEEGNMAVNEEAFAGLNVSGSS